MLRLFAEHLEGLLSAFGHYAYNVYAGCRKFECGCALDCGRCYGYAVDCVNCNCCFSCGGYMKLAAGCVDYYVLSLVGFDAFYCGVVGHQSCVGNIHTLQNRVFIFACTHCPDTAEVPADAGVSGLLLHLVGVGCRSCLYHAAFCCLLFGGPVCAVFAYHCSVGVIDVAGEVDHCVRIVACAVACDEGSRIFRIAVTGYGSVADRCAILDGDCAVGFVDEADEAAGPAAMRE